MRFSVTLGTDTSVYRYHTLYGFAQLPGPCTFNIISTMNDITHRKEHNSRFSMFVYMYLFDMEIWGCVAVHVARWSVNRNVNNAFLLLTCLCLKTQRITNINNAFQFFQAAKKIFSRHLPLVSHNIPFLFQTRFRHFCVLVHRRLYGQLFNERKWKLSENWRITYT